MPATYDKIASQTLGSSTSTVTFSSIAGTYTDLVLIAAGRTSTGVNVVMRLNGDTGSNYSVTHLSGNGSSASSGRETNQGRMLTDANGYWDNTNVSNKIMQFQNYANTSTFKTVLMRDNNAGVGLDALVGLWRSTSAITQIDILCLGGPTFSAGSTFTLYGIKAA